MCITVLDSIYNIMLSYYLPFVLEVFVQWQNLTIFNKLKDEPRDEPWQQVMHAYYGRWRIFMALYFEMHQLPWLKRYGRRPRKTLANPEPFK